MPKCIYTTAPVEITTSFGGFHVSTTGDVRVSTTGDVRLERDEALTTEWEIGNFPAESHFESPVFTFLRSTWHLEVGPCKSDKEWISLYLSSNDCNPLRIVAFELSTKKPDGALFVRHAFVRKIEKNTKYGIRYFTKISQLPERKDEIITQKSLTIICKMRSPIPTADKSGVFVPGLMDIFSSKKHSDLSILVKDHEFRAHKAILSASSKVFSAMFDHEMSENNCGVLNIEDCEPESFEEFLRFLYAGETDITDSNVYQLYTIGHKYCVQELIISCVGYMIIKVSVDNICDVATLGDRYSDKDLIFACSEFFEENIREILLTSQWKSLMKDNYLAACKLLDYIASRITVEKYTSCINSLAYQYPLFDAGQKVFTVHLKILATY